MLFLHQGRENQEGPRYPQDYRALRPRARGQLPPAQVGQLLLAQVGQLPPAWVGQRPPTSISEPFIYQPQIELDSSASVPTLMFLYMLWYGTLQHVCTFRSVLGFVIK